MTGLRHTLRHTIQHQRDSLSASERAAWSHRIGAHVLAHPWLHGVRRVGLFASMGSEVATAPLFARLQALGVRVALPRVVGKGQALAFVDVPAWDTLRPGTFGVPEPVGPAMDTALLQVIVVPGLVFDHAGHRLGYGMGYYDRTLAAFPGRTLGVAFAMQVVQALPVQAHDVAVQAVITEAGVLGA